jgi:hypothetical protein
MLRNDTKKTLKKNQSSLIALFRQKWTYHTREVDALQQTLLIA